MCQQGTTPTSHYERQPKKVQYIFSPRPRHNLSTRKKCNTKIRPTNTKTTKQSSYRTKGPTTTSQMYSRKRLQTTSEVHYAVGGPHANARGIHDTKGGRRSTLNTSAMRKGNTKGRRNINLIYSLRDRRASIPTTTSHPTTNYRIANFSIISRVSQDVLNSVLPPIETNDRPNATINRNRGYTTIRVAMSINNISPSIRQRSNTIQYCQCSLSIVMLRR